VKSLILTSAKTNSPAGFYLAAISAVCVGLCVGAAAALVNPLIAAAALAAPIVLVLLLSNTQAGLLAVTCIIYLLPFGVIPLPLGPVKLTLLDATLSVLLLVWIGRLLTQPGEHLEGSPLGGMVVVFIGLATVSFLVGLSYAPITAESVRFFLKAINSILLFFTIVNCVRTRRDLEQLVAAVILGGAAAAALAVGLYYLPAETATRLLSSLKVLGYASGPNVLRYNAATGVLRAIGTSVDPNVLGAALMVSSTLCFGQLLSARPVLRRSWLVLSFGLIAVALLLTYSRGSWIGFLVGLFFLAAFRERRLFIPLLLLAASVYFFGGAADESFAGHLVSGLTFQDQAAAMRLGEYKDAQRLIARYPWFGVGFGEAPSVDLYVGVSSIYLLLAEQMGLVGLASFLLTIVALYVVSLRRLLSMNDPGLRMLLISLLAATTAALAAGVGDHYFVNMRFPHTVALFWFIIGLNMVAGRLQELPEGSDARRN